jgi:signal peptidase I
VTQPPDSSTEDESGPSAQRGAGGARRSRATERRPLPVWQEMVLLVAIALVLAFVIKAFFMQAFYIPSASMNDTLVKDDRIVVQKVSFWMGGPHRGDVVVFADPGGWLGSGESQQAANAVTKGLEKVGLYPTGGHLVKRIIGVGGDEVRCCDERGRMTVNGVPLNEKSYLATGERPSMIDFDVRVQKGFVWVQGDNRSNSADSRVHLGDPGGGQVPVDDLVGKVVGVVWPLGHVKTLSTPATFDSVH